MLEEETTRVRRVVVDSGARDLEAYPSPSKYEVELEDDLEDVHELRLLTADVPFPGYLLPAAVPLAGGVGVVSGTGTAVPVTWGLSSAVAVMEPGDYTSVPDLAAGLATALAAVAPGVFDVTVNTRLSSVVVWSITSIFTLGPVDRAVARALGLTQGAVGTSVPDSTYTASGGTGSGFVVSIRAPFRAVLQPDRYAVLSITPNAEALISPTDAVNRTFAVLPRDGQHKLSVCVQGAAYRKSWTPPVARITRIGVNLTDRWGNPFDSQNQDHRLEFEFVISKSRSQRFASQAAASTPQFKPIHRFQM